MSLKRSLNLHRKQLFGVTEVKEATTFGIVAVQLSTSALHKNLQAANFQRCEHLCLAYIVTCVPPLQVTALECTLLEASIKAVVM